MRFGRLAISGLDFLDGNRLDLEIDQAEDLARVHHLDMNGIVAAVQRDHGAVAAFRNADRKQIVSSIEQALEIEADYRDLTRSARVVGRNANRFPAIGRGDLDSIRSANREPVDRPCDVRPELDLDVQTRTIAGGERGDPLPCFVEQREIDYAGASIAPSVLETVVAGAACEPILVRCAIIRKGAFGNQRCRTWSFGLHSYGRAARRAEQQLEILCDDGLRLACHHVAAVLEQHRSRAMAQDLIY